MVMCCFLDQCVWDLFHGTGTIYVCAVLYVQYLGAFLVLVSVFLRPVRGCYFFIFFAPMIVCCCYLLALKTTQSLVQRTKKSRSQ